MVVSFNNDSIKGVNIHHFSMTSCIGINFAIIICLVELLLELYKVLLISYSSSLRNFRQSSGIVFEKQTASFHNLSEFTFRDRFDGYFLHFVDLDEVD